MFTFNRFFFNCRIVICLFGVLVCCSTAYELYARSKSTTSAIGYKNKAFEATDDKAKDIQLNGVNTISHDVEKNKTASDPVVQREMNGTAAVVVQQEDQLQLNTQPKKGTHTFPPGNMICISMFNSYVYTSNKKEKVYQLRTIEVAFAKGLAKHLQKTLCDGIINKGMNK